MALSSNNRKLKLSRRILRGRFMRTILTLLGAVLMTAVFAYAHAAAPVSLPANDPSTANALEAQIAQRAASLLAPEVQIRGVVVGLIRRFE